MKMYLRQNKAITLIALVITIIVLLILAGVTIASLTGDNGLLSRAIGAKEESEKATIIEKARTEIMAKIAENIGKDITKKELTAEEVKDILDDYFNSDQVSNADLSVLDTKLQTTDGKYTIKLEKILSGVAIADGEVSRPVAYLDTPEFGTIEVPAGVTLENVQWVIERDRPGFGYRGEILDGVVEKTRFVYDPAYGNTFLQRKGYFYQGELLMDTEEIYCNFYDSHNVKLGADDLLQENEHYTWDSVSCFLAGTLITVEEDEEDENGNKKKRRKKKKIEELTYKDKLLVWNFDTGEFAAANPLWLSKANTTTQYNLLKFSDGSELKTINQHRIFNKELGKFTYPMTDETPIGTITFNEQGEEIKLVSKEIIEENVEYYNVITNYHMNAFAEGILTSCRFSNLYDIKDMKYVKDNRELVSREEYKDIPDDYFYGLRLSEQPKEVNRGNDVKMDNSIIEYVKRLIFSAK